ncbi:MAG: hypothetical protein KDE66_09750, partial [Nitrosomonas sp.]|nr:hypothetical protein [Nitrosomonas sp.]
MDNPYFFTIHRCSRKIFLIYQLEETKYQAAFSRVRSSKSGFGIIRQNGNKTQLRQVRRLFDIIKAVYRKACQYS